MEKVKEKAAPGGRSPEDGKGKYSVLMIAHGEKGCKC